jgi:hypothetical protein
VLIGGFGRDTLKGDLGRDTFDFNTLTESPRGSGRDTVYFDGSQGDRIDLSSIDADTAGTAGIQKFKFIGSQGFHSIDGELRFSRGLLQGDINGDKIADIEIRVVGLLTGVDIIL